MTPASGSPLYDALGTQHHVGHEAEVLAREVRARAGHAALDLVGDEDDAVLRAPRLQGRQVAIGRNDESALALDGLDDQAREIDGSDRLFEVRDRAGRGLGARQAVVVRVRVRRAVDIARERSESGGVRGRLEVHGHREVGTTVVGVLQHGDTGAPGVLAGDLHRVLDRLGTRVHEHGLLGEVSGRVLGEQLGDPHVFFVRCDGEQGVGDLAQLSGGGLDDGRRRVTDRGHADARAQVDELIAVGIDQNGAVGPLDVDRQCRSDAHGHHGQASLVQRNALGAGDRRDDLALLGDGERGSEGVCHDASSLSSSPAGPG